MKRSALGVAVAAATLAAAPGIAEAATVTVSPSQACYVTGDRVSMTAGGFGPMDQAEVKLNNDVFGPIQMDASGSAAATLTFGTGTLHGVHVRDLIVDDSSNPALSATVPMLTAPVEIRMTTGEQGAGQARRVKATGFTSGAVLYAHQVRRHFIRTFRVGRLHGPCHTLSVVARVTQPGAPSGWYTEQFDTSRRYSHKTYHKVVWRLQVWRRVVPAVRLRRLGGAVEHRSGGGVGWG